MPYVTLMPFVISPKRRTVNTASFGPMFVNIRQIGLAAAQSAQSGLTSASPSHGQLFVPAMAMGSVATMVTMSGRLIGGGDGRTVIFTGQRSWKRRRCPWPRAINTCPPNGTFVQIKTNRFVGGKMIGGSEFGNRPRTHRRRIRLRRDRHRTDGISETQAVCAVKILHRRDASIRGMRIREDGERDRRVKHHVVWRACDPHQRRQIAYGANRDVHGRRDG